MGMYWRGWHKIRRLDALSAFRIAGVDKFNVVIGVAGGYKIARGTHTPTTASDTIVTDLATVVAAVASFKGAPSATVKYVAADIGNQTGAPAAGSIYIKTYKQGATFDAAPVAATTSWDAIDWVAIGT